MSNPTILTDPHNFMVEPLREMGDAWGDTFNAFFNCHYIQKTPESMLLACEDPNDSDAWLVWWAEYYPRASRKEMLATFLRAIPYYKPRIRWARPRHGRPSLANYSTDKLFKIAGLPLPRKKPLTSSDPGESSSEASIP